MKTKTRSVSPSQPVAKPPTEPLEKRESPRLEAKVSTNQKLHQHAGHHEIFEAIEAHRRAQAALNSELDRLLRRFCGVEKMHGIWASDLDRRERLLKEGE
jgi:hypothetical protein